ncbi:uncharacterized protein LOC144609402 isoform X4 [Rhinoraja longicauda]
MQSQMLKLGEIINHPTQYANIHCGLIVKQAFFSPSDAAVRSNLRFLRSVTMETTRFCSHSDPAEAADRSSGSAIKTAVASFVGLHRPASEMSSTGAGLRSVDYEVFGNVQGVFFRKVRLLTPNGSVSHPLCHP